MDQKQVAQSQVEEDPFADGPAADKTEEEFIQRYQLQQVLQSSDAEHGVERQTDAGLVSFFGNRRTTL